MDTGYDWVNPDLDIIGERNCRFYIEAFNCRDAATIQGLHWLAAAVEILCLLIIGGCVVRTEQIRSGPRLVTEKVVISWSIFIALRLLFTAALLSRILDTQQVLLSVIQCIAWPFIFIAYSIYMDNVLSVMPGEKICEATAIDAYRRQIRRLFAICYTFICLSTVVLSTLSGWARVTDRFSLELVLYRTLKFLCAFYCFLCAATTWHASGRLQRRVDQRTNIMSQYVPQLNTESTLRSLVSEGSQGSLGTAAVAQYRLERFHESRQRLYLLNLAIVVGSIFFALMLLVYAAALPTVVTTPALNITFHIMVNVMPPFLIGGSSVAFAVGSLQHHMNERQRIERMQQGSLGKSGSHECGNDNDRCLLASSSGGDPSLVGRPTIDRVMLARAMNNLPAEIQLRPLNDIDST